MIRVKAEINLSYEVTLNSNVIETGFRITIKIGNKGYITRLEALDSKCIPLGKKTCVYMDILYGELEIEKMLEHCTFDFVSWKTLGKGKIIDVMEIFLEKEVLNKVDTNRKTEILSAIEKHSIKCNNL